jgi:ferritin-like metal-binding protein YciE
MGEDFDEATMDACLIASGQRAEHYEMAAYGTLISWAKTLGHKEVAGLLEDTLKEEKAADAKLNELAEEGINEQAADGANVDDHPTDKPQTSARGVAAVQEKKLMRSVAKRH